MRWPIWLNSQIDKARDGQSIRRDGVRKELKKNVKEAKSIGNGC